ncbi:shikimate dehydrogenase [Rhodobacterales bacterium HKCCE3408]|nr:shikimate dehydrogenase [Rhodobacterales bacterium HKCCE3408]
MAQPAGSGTVSDGAGARRIQVGLVGRGIQKSRTPRMHEAEARAIGLDLGYRLLDADAEPLGPLDEILDRAEADGFAGLNITYPFKQDVIALLDELSPAARKIGAVNTVVFRDGRRFGHNTDFWGFSEGFRRGLGTVPIDAILQLGAGGAGAAVAFALADLGAGRINIYDTRPEAARDLATAVNAIAGTDIAAAVTDPGQVASTMDGIVNTTPVGMAKLPGTAIDVALIDPRHWVAEIIYFPLETELLHAARAKGCRTLDGSGMAVFQAVRAFHLFTGLDPDPVRMRATFEARAET